MRSARGNWERRPGQSSPRPTGAAFRTGQLSSQPTYHASWTWKCFSTGRSKHSAESSETFSRKIGRLACSRRFCGEEGVLPGAAPGCVVKFAEGRERQIPLEQLPAFASEEGNPGNAKHVTGLLVPPHRPAQLAAAFEKLIHDPALRRRLGSAGRDWATRNCWKESAAALFSVAAIEA